MCETFCTLSLPLEQRLSILEQAIRDGSALAVQCALLKKYERVIEKGEKPLIPQDALPRFKTLLLAKLDERITNDTLLCHPNLMRILSMCIYWCADKSKIKIWCTDVTRIDDGMFTFIKKFIYSTQHLADTLTTTHHINLQLMERYVDISDFEKRIVALQEESKIPQEYEETAALFLQSVELYRKGITPENTF